MPYHRSTEGFDRVVWFRGVPASTARAAGGRLARAYAIFLKAFVFPTSEGSRLTAVIKLWLVGTVIVAAVINLTMAVLDLPIIARSCSPASSGVRIKTRAG